MCIHVSFLSVHLSYNIVCLVVFMLYCSFVDILCAFGSMWEMEYSDVALWGLPDTVIGGLLASEYRRRLERNEGAVEVWFKYEFEGVSGYMGFCSNSSSYAMLVDYVRDDDVHWRLFDVVWYVSHARSGSIGTVGGILDRLGVAIDRAHGESVYTCLRRILVTRLGVQEWDENFICLDPREYHGYLWVSRRFSAAGGLMNTFSCRVQPRNAVAFRVYVSPHLWWTVPSTTCSEVPFSISVGFELDVYFSRCGEHGIFFF